MDSQSSGSRFVRLDQSYSAPHQAASSSSIFQHQGVLPKAKLLAQVPAHPREAVLLSRSKNAGGKKSAESLLSDV